MPVDWNKKTVLGTIGYHNLSNHSIAPLLIEKIKQLEWAKNVTVEEMNWGPIAIVQWFQTLEIPFERVVLFTAIQRPKRKIGDITIFKWGGGIPDDKEVQARVGDAVTGVISPENLLIIGEYFKIWPKEVYLVDVEPGREKAGETLTTKVGEKVMDYLKILELVCKNGCQVDKNCVILQGDKIAFK